MENFILKRINFFKGFPTHLQFDQTDCGPTCVKIMLDYYKLNVPLSFIKEICFSDLQGTNILDVSNALEYFNFDVVTTKVDIETLINQGPLPSVLLFDNNHYVVLYRISNNEFYISDPEFGKYKLNKELFIERWIIEDKGIVVFVNPNKDVKKYHFDTNKSSITNKFFDYYIKGNLKAFFIILLISGLLALSNLAFPILTKKIVDEAIPNNNYYLVAVIVTTQIIIILAGNIFGFINEKIFIKINSKLNVEALSEFLYKLSRIPFKFFELKNVSDIIQRVGDHTRIESFITNNISSIIYSVISVFSFSILLLQYNAIIFFIFLFSILLSLLWTLSFTSKRNLLEYKRYSSYKNSMSSSFEIVQGMVDLKLNNAENYRINDWKQKQNKIYQTKEESLIIESKITFGNILISQIKNALITFICAYSVINKSLTLGEMLSISYIIGTLNAPLGTFLDFIKKWNEARFSFLRINEIKDMYEENSNTSKCINNFAEINIKSVNFKYNINANTKILNNIHLNIKKGQKIAFVGKSGSGKTTMMKLLLKFYNPTEGNILIDQFNLNNINAENWRKLCGVVMQDGYIFTGSVLDNIILDKTRLDYDRLNHVCYIANIKEHIDSLPKGYDTIIGQKGKGMSGGQIQRILIARALYQNPEILIFDEATSALDTYNENLIMNNIYKYSEDKTMIIIAHRLSTIKDVDVIYVFDKGKIIEQGNHQELIAMKNEYFNLVKNQLDITC